MPEYRAYIVGRDGHFLGCEAFVSENDDKAAEQAHLLVDGHDVELCSGPRIIVRLHHQARSENT
jgi:hypothetical protein